ncbi:MAG: SagB/ThcOx family dehydrogenase [Gammaproteobacteria bacterium]|nr:SagB/ThcOx family dehydrogenase [Gammaproteobacteria bacterium]
MNNFQKGREFLKSSFTKNWREHVANYHKKANLSLFKKNIPKNSTLVKLVNAKDFKIPKLSLMDAIKNRKTRRKFNDLPLNFEELSFLLWVTQGARKITKHFRNVPSGGARHPFETYLYLRNVKGIPAGLYLYMPLKHQLCLLPTNQTLEKQILDACYNQTPVKQAAVIFLWSVVPARSEWLFGPAAHKMIAEESGHICQNLYLAVEAIQCGTCAIGAYDQKIIDKALGLNGKDEFITYIAAVGKA